MTRTTRLATATLSAAVAVLAGIASALGIFARGDGTFVSVTSARGEIYEAATNGVYAHSARQLVAEGVGWDVFTLVVAVPLLLIGATLVARGSFRGALLAAGMLGYVAYMYLEYAVTWAFGPLFGLFILITAGSVLGLLGAGAVVAGAGVRGRFSDQFPRRAWAGLSIGMAVLLTVLWISRIADGLAAVTPVLHGESTMTVQALDLGLVMPVSLALAILALRRVPAALAAATAFAVTFVTLSAAIASMMISAWLVTGVVNLPPIVIFGAAAMLGALLAARMFHSVRAEASPSATGSLTRSSARPAHLPAAGT